jgi:hypothetical protein
LVGLKTEPACLLVGNVGGRRRYYRERVQGSGHLRWVAGFGEQPDLALVACDVDATVAGASVLFMSSSVD